MATEIDNHGEDCGSMTVKCTGLALGLFESRGLDHVYLILVQGKWYCGSALSHIPLALRRNCIIPGLSQHSPR